MAKRLRAVVEMWYPDAKSLPVVVEAGGMSKLTAEQREKVKTHIRHVKPGEWCDDLPECDRAIRLERGDVVEVEADPVKRATPRRAK